MPRAAEAVPLSLRKKVRNKKDRLPAALEVLEAHGLGGLGYRSVHTLSGGQKQLLAMAGVLATRPSILVADEPTTLLDLRNSRRIAELLFRIDNQLVLVTHDLDLAAQCERALVFDQARVDFVGAAPAAVPTSQAMKSDERTAGKESVRKG